MGRRRWPWWKTLSAVLGSVVGMLALAVAWTVWRTHVAWAGLDARIEAHHRIALRRPVLRPLLHATTRPGDAWPHYRHASEALRKVRFDGWREEDFYGGELVAEMAGWRLIREHAEALASLGRGARCATAETPDLAPWLGAEPESSGGWGHVLMLAGIDAWLKCVEGREDEAAERVLDLLQLGRDLSESKGYCVAYWYSTALYWAERPLLRLLGLPWLRPETRRSLDRALALLEETPPDSKAMLRRETIRFGRGIRRYGTFAHLKDVVLTKDELPEWQKVKPVDRFFGVRAFRRMEEFIEFMPEDARTVWPEGYRTPAERWTFAARGVVPNVCPSWDDLPFRLAQARLRVLRMAVDRLAGTAAEPLADPFGGRLRVLERDGMIHFWSVGANGVDDGGPDAARNRDVRVSIPSSK